VSQVAQVRRCVLVKWSQRSSGMMKCRVTGSSIRLHSEKVELIDKLWLCFGMIFPVCYLYCNAVDIASDAIYANWCLLGYIILVKTLTIIARRSLNVYCNLEFRHYAPPLY
jgi:hypothetical protein